MPMNTTSYTPGDTVRLSFSVLSTAGVGVGTHVTLIVNSPTTKWVRSATSSGTTALVRESAGHWHADYPVTNTGRHTWTFRSTGTIRSTTSGAFTVRALEATS